MSRIGRRITNDDARAIARTAGTTLAGVLSGEIEAPRANALIREQNARIAGLRLAPAVERTPKPPKRKRVRAGGVRKVCSCPPRQWAKCDHPWHFAFKWTPPKPPGAAARPKAVHYRFSLDRETGRHIDSKTEALALADEYRGKIRKGEFRPAAPPRAEMTLRQLGALYFERSVSVAHADTKDDYEDNLNVIYGTTVPLPTGGELAFGDWRVTDIVTDTVERFREIRRAAGGGIFGTNRLTAALRALFNWGLRVGYVDQTPFKRNGEPMIELWEEPTRSRRLDADQDEEARLLAACKPELRAIVECALQTGMRSGEITSLQWHQVKGVDVDVERSRVTWQPRAEIKLLSTKTKSRRERKIPISSRLRAILELRRFDPAGQPLPLTAYVFGNAIGQRVKHRTRAWHAAVLRAHGHTPTYTKSANLDAESRATLAAIDLHFHDLRREAGSRWLEGGVPLLTIRDWLGHTNISQTSTYLSGTMKTQHDAMLAFEQRRAAVCNAFATEGGKGGIQPPSSAATQHEKTNKDAVGRDASIM